MTTRIEPGTLLNTVMRWEVPEKPHCSNCRFAIVQGNPDKPETYCAKGHGNVMDLWALIRSMRPRQFTPAERCPDFEGMGR